MKQLRLSHAFNLAFRLLMILGLLWAPPVSWAQEQVAQQQANSAPLVSLGCNPNPICKETINGVQIIRVNTSDPRIVIKPGFGSNGSRALIKDIVNSRGAVIGINADYQSNTCTVNCWQGATWLDGAWMAPSPSYGETWRGRRNIRFSKSKSMSIDIGQNNRSDDWWNAVAGGPQFIRGGSFWWDDPQFYCLDGSALPNCSRPDKKKVIINGEHFDAQGTQWWYRNSSSRMSAVGFSGSTLVLAASENSISNEAMANLLISQGVTNALRLDGGGSTQVYSRYSGAEVDLRSSDSPERAIADGLLVFVRDVPPCPAPGLRDPAPGQSMIDRNVTFKWDDVSCEHNGFNLRVKTVPSMDSGGETVVDIQENSLQKAVSFGSQWDEHDLYWSVRAANNPGAAWASTRQFKISTNRPPSISFDTANGNSASQIYSRDTTWTFQGTASDFENRLDRVEFRCSGDGCGSGPEHTSNGNWSLARTGMWGKNDIYFIAYDDRQNTASRHLELNIDLAAPATTSSLNNEANAANWPAWFTAPVQVRLQAEDGSTGRARVGVREIRYRVDGGNWQSSNGSDVTFTVNTDGNHAVTYYAIDQLSNQEGERTINFKIDATPPTPPGNASETHGVLNNQWQKVHNIPTFTWPAASDVTSGLWGYQLYFGDDPNGTSYQSFLTSAPRQWTPLPDGVRTNTYYLRGRTRDNAGNYSNWVTLFTYRYDGTPPENPATATHAAGISNETWQRTTNLPNFTWPSPHDEGSGIKGYYVFWGTNAEGVSTAFNAATSFQSATPLCAANAACVGYLRVRSADNVDNQAEQWSTVFTLRYDNAPPILDLSLNGGVTQTAQTQISLNINASDQGSGVKAMRFSADGVSWTDWEAYAATRSWLLPPISRESWPVYAQVRDGVGLASAVVTKEIYLDVNTRQPRSANFRLFDHTLSAGAGVHSSSAYRARSTVGQVLDSAHTSSTNFQLTGGYEAGSQAIPLVEPGHDEFTFVNGIFASGVVANTMQSASFQMIGTLGEPGLPSNITTLASSNFRHQPGFLAAAPAANTTSVPLPTQTPGPTPPAEPTPDCAFPQVTINNNASFTYAPNVTLHICAPRAVEMRVSNDENFNGASWEPYIQSKGWTLLTSGQLVAPRFVYVSFRNADGTIHGAYFDDIILDPNAPSGNISIGDSIPTSLREQNGNEGRTTDGLPVSLTVASTIFVPLVQNPGTSAYLVNQAAVLRAASADNAVDLFISAQDDNSGIATMQVSTNTDFSDASWEPYSALKLWTLTGGDGTKTLYVRFRDRTGNVSAATNASVILDTQAPVGGLSVVDQIVGRDTVTVTLYLAAEDNLTGVTDMRVSTDANFADAVWQPLVYNLVWPITVQSGQTAGTVYAQFRDLAGNISPTYSADYLVDSQPPVVYVEVDEGETLTRTVHIYAYDELSQLRMLSMSNDPRLLDQVLTSAYTDTLTWRFDEHRVVWVQVQDNVGNWSEPYPAYAAAGTSLVAPILSISKAGANINLSWLASGAVQSYQLHRSSIPFFTPSASTLLATLPADATSYTDTGAAGNPAVSYFYTLRAISGVNSVDASQVGTISYALNNSGGKYSLIASPFSSTTINNAAALATHIGNVGALLKWNPATQSFRFFAPPSTGDNFTIAQGEAIFVLVNSGGPSLVTMTGAVSQLQHTLRPGGFNFLSVPLQKGNLANAAALAADLSGVQSLLAWNAATQTFRFFAPPSSGDNFAVRPGMPFIVSLGTNSGSTWPTVAGSHIEFAPASTDDPFDLARINPHSFSTGTASEAKRFLVLLPLIGNLP